MIDLFYECEENDIANYADDTTPYSCGTDIHTVISELQDISKKVLIGLVIIIWKSIQVNVTYYLVISPEVVPIDGIQTTSSTAQTLL